MRRMFAVAAGVVTVLLGVTWWALESSGVAVVTTQADSGSRSTHVWYVEDAGELVLEAGSPENPWFRDIQVRSQLRFSAKEFSGTYVAKPAPNPEGHRRVRRLLREKYGVRDWWIELLFGTTHSVAVLLEPAP